MHSVPPQASSSQVNQNVLSPADRERLQKLFGHLPLVNLADNISADLAERHAEAAEEDLLAQVTGPNGSGIKDNPPIKDGPNGRGSMDRQIHATTKPILSLKRFFELVVPWDVGGYLSIHWLLPGGMPGRSCRTVDDALNTVAELARGKVNIYFCLSRQKLNAGHRDRDNALALCSVWMDLDIDPDNPKKYATIEEALANLFLFCDQLGIPRPSILVASGHGLHAYWLSDRTLTVEEWQPYADALKTAARNKNLKIDASVTGDAARVLRVPGTTNYKKPDAPKPVRLLQRYCNEVRHDFASIFAGLLELAPSPRPARAKPIKIAELFKPLGVGPNLAGDIEDYSPQPFEPIKAGCAWLRDVHETGGKDEPEPRWYQALRCGSYMENGNALAHEFSNKHGEYVREKTEAKFEHAMRSKNLGWPQCRTIHEKYECTHCATCPHLNENKSPLNLGLRPTGLLLLDPSDPPSRSVLAARWGMLPTNFDRDRRQHNLELSRPGSTVHRKRQARSLQADPSQGRRCPHCAWRYLSHQQLHRAANMVLTHRHAISRRVFRLWQRPAACSDWRVVPADTGLF
jgi:hypothetical protein